MADYKNYDELLKRYEPKQEPKPESEQIPEATVDAKDVRPASTSKAADVPMNSSTVRRSATPSANTQRRATPVDSTQRRATPVGNTPNKVSTEGKAPERAKTSSADRAVSRKPSPPPVTGDKSNFRGGVYFSNPPKANTNKPAPNGSNAPQQTAANPNTRRKANMQEKKKTPDNKFMRFLKSKGLRRFAIMVAVIAVVSTILCSYAIGCINDVLGISDEEISIEVTIKQGMTDEEVIDLLAEKGLINNKMFCKLFIKIFEKDGPYISNTYTLSPQMGIEKMIAIMKTDYTLGEIVTLTFPEGWTIQQIADKLEANDVCTASAFVTTLQTVDFSDEYTFIAALDNKDQRFRTLEGYLYPDTYQFYVGENPSSVIRRFLDNFQAKWTEEYGQRAAELGMSIDEVITLASVIQMEAANYDQMPGVSSVIHNRLDNTYTFPRLECDSTTAYYSKVIAPQFTNSSDDLKKLENFRNRYDTYDADCTGLPVGAIANPGGDAISAALYPSDTGYYFFNHDVNGGIYYAVTAAEHDRNVAIAESVEPE